MTTEKLVGSQLEALLPQRFPFIFLDSIEQYESNKRAKGSKNICSREPLLLDDACKEWPGAYVVESLGQLAIALLNMQYIDKQTPKILLGRISGVTFHSKIPLGSKLDLRIDMDAYVEGDSFIVSGYADVAGERKVTMNSLVAKIIIEDSKAKS
jgi:3-hydroxyacyl-[acyl-carrier-protein] dehydratase